MLLERCVDSRRVTTLADSLRLRRCTFRYELAGCGPTISTNQFSGFAVYFPAVKTRTTMAVKPYNATQHFNNRLCNIYKSESSPIGIKIS